jgi:hypothetical protein
LKDIPWLGEWWQLPGYMVFMVGMHLHKVRINSLQMEYEYNDVAIYMLEYKKIQQSNPYIHGKDE